MDINSSRISQSVKVNNTSSTQQVISNESTSKTRVSQSKGQQPNTLAQKKNQDEITKNISEKFEAGIQEDNEIPVIRYSAKPLTSQAQVLLMISRIQGISHEIDANKLANSLEIFAAQSEAKIKKATELSNELDKLNDSFDKQNEYVDKCKGDFDSAFEKEKKASLALGDARYILEDNIDRLNRFINMVNPPASALQIEVAEKNVADAQQAYDDAEQVYNDANKSRIEAATILTVAGNDLQKIVTTINQKTAEMNRLYGNVFIPSSSVKTAVEQSEQALTRTAIMIQLITEFIMKMDKVASDKLQNDLKINAIQMRSRQEEMTRKSDEYEEKVRKAEEMQKIMGIVGKALGALAMLIGAITSVFGGAGIALMAVGLALMTTDVILEAATGESLTGMIMEPIMEHVFMPLMEIIGDIVDEIFEYTPLGALLKAIDEATGADMMDTIHTVVSAVIAIAIIVAIAYFAKSAGKILIEKMSKMLTTAVIEAIKKAIQKIISKMIPQILKNVAKSGGAAINQIMKAMAKQITQVMQKSSQQITKNMPNAIKNSSSTMMQNLAKINANHLAMVRVGVDVSNGVTQSVMNMNIANIQLEASKALASVELANTDMQILRDTLSSVISRFTQEQELSRGMVEDLSVNLMNMHSSGQFVLRNMKA